MTVRRAGDAGLKNFDLCEELSPKPIVLIVGRPLGRHAFVRHRFMAENGWHTQVADAEEREQEQTAWTGFSTGHPPILRKPERRNCVPAHSRQV